MKGDAMRPQALLAAALLLAGCAGIAPGSGEYDRIQAALRGMGVRTIEGTLDQTHRYWTNPRNGGKIYDATGTLRAGACVDHQAAAVFIWRDAPNRAALLCHELAHYRLDPYFP